MKTCPCCGQYLKEDDEDVLDPVNVRRVLLSKDRQKTLNELVPWRAFYDGGRQDRSEIVSELWTIVRQLRRQCDGLKEIFPKKADELEEQFFRTSEDEIKSALKQIKDDE